MSKVRAQEFAGSCKPVCLKYYSKKKEIKKNPDITIIIKLSWHLKLFNKRVLC